MGRPFRARDRRATLGRGMGNLTLACWGALPSPEARHNRRRGAQTGPGFAPGLGRVRCQGSGSGGHVPSGITASSGQPGGGAARSPRPR